MVLATLALLVVGAAWASATYNTSIVSVNAGNPSWAGFYFETVPDYTGPGWEGSTELFIECDFARAELITNFDEYGKQQSSQFFPVNCTQKQSRNGLNQPVVEETLNNTPFTVNLTMYGYNNTTSQMTLTVYQTTWQATLEGCGRSECFRNDVGSSQIAY